MKHDKRRGGRRWARAVEREWVGGRLLTRSYVMEPEPYRPEVILWLELPDDLIVGLALVDPKGPPVSVSQVLLEAMEHPAEGAPRRPRRVRVSDEAMAAELRATVSGIEVVVAPTPELDAVIELMANNMPTIEEDASDLEGGRIPEALVEKMFRASEEIWRLQPWEVADNGQVVRVDIPRLGVDGACLAIIGNLGESFALLLFPSLEGFEAFGSAPNRPRRGGLPDLGTTVLSLEFDRVVDMPPSMRREVAQLGRPVPESGVYPHVGHRDRDGIPRPVSEHDVRVVTALATSFAPFFIKNRELFQPDAAEAVREVHYDEDNLEICFTLPYEAHEAFETTAPLSRSSVSPSPTPLRRFEPKTERNAPCPCGSGKKYKKCCLRKDEQAAAAAGTGGAGGDAN